MSWSTTTIALLDAWAGPETCHKNEPSDDERFEAFVNAVWNDEHELWNEREAQQALTSKVKAFHPEWGEELIRAVVQDRVSVGTCQLREIKAGN